MYPVNEMMKEELDFLQKALQPESKIVFETPIAPMIPRKPTASLFVDSLLTGCSGYSLKLKFWWHLDFLIKIGKLTLLHISDKSDVRFIPINCLEYFTITINYCGARVHFATILSEDDLYPLPSGSLCLLTTLVQKMDNSHQQKSLTSQALARFFIDF